VWDKKNWNFLIAHYATTNGTNYTKFIYFEAGNQLILLIFF